MTRLASVVRSIEVAVDPATAFRVFTEEIGDWYRGGLYGWEDPTRAVGIRFEPRRGGRWIEVWDAASGQGFEKGRILVWEPGRRLVVTYRSERFGHDPPTEIEVRFEPADGGTRVVLEHRGIDRVPSDAARSLGIGAWAGLMRSYRDHLARGAPGRREDRPS